ncbi:MAG: ATP-binding protein [Melioribacteraceae bacterium]|nr:ATP-binding protein [Melioribacteraceae bacterium]
MENQLYLALQNNSLFNNIEFDSINLDSVKGNLLTVKEGQIIYRDGLPSEQVYLIVSGEVNILKKRDSGKTLSMIFTENEFFGHEEFLDNVPRSSTVIALRDSYIIVLSRSEIENLISQDQSILLNLQSAQTFDADYPQDEMDNQSYQNNTKQKPGSEFHEPDHLHGAVSNVQYPDEMFSSHNNSEEISKEKKKPRLDDDTDLPSNKEIENFESPEDYEEHSQSFEKVVSDETDELGGSDEKFLNGISSEDELRKIDELISGQNSNEEEFSLDKLEEISDEDNGDDLRLNSASDDSEVVFSGEEDMDNEQLTDESSIEEIRHEKINTSFNENSSQDISQEHNALSSEDLNMLIKAAELVNSNLKLDDLLVNIVDVAANLLHADRGTLYIIDEENNELWSKVAMGEEMKEIRLKIGEGVAGWVAQSGEVLNLSNAQDDERFKADYDKVSGYKTKSMICFPIKNKENKTIGVLQLLNSKEGEFSQLDESLLSALSIHCALALENAALLEKLLQAERISSLGKMANFLIQDIKKPVLVSKRYADHLKEKDLPPEIKQVLEMMTDQLNQVADLVQTTSAYSQGKSVLRTVTSNLNDLLNDYVNRLDSYLRSKNCQVVTELDIPTTVKVDQKEFFQCFNHLIKNACEAMPDGGNIILTTKVEESHVKITVRDNGLGIPDGLKEKIFEPFMSHGKKEGTGLGLSITKKLIEDHGGNIKVESTLGEGASFVISLPLAHSF